MSRPAENLLDRVQGEAAAGAQPVGLLSDGRGAMESVAPLPAWPGEVDPDVRR